MTTPRSLGLITASCLATLFTASCTDQKTAANDSLPAVREVATATPKAAATDPSVIAAGQPAVAASPAGIEPSSVKWSDIKDQTFSMRTTFLAGMAGLEAGVDRQISELQTRRAGFAVTTSTGSWDFAMKEMNNARTFLKSSGEDLAHATAENWNDRRDQVGLAWIRTQEAYGKVLAATTN